MTRNVESVDSPVGANVARRFVPPGGSGKTVVITASNYAQTATTEAKSILARNNSRAYLFVQNLGTQNVFIFFANQPPQGTSGVFPGAIRIPPGGFYEPSNDRVPVDTVYAVCNAGVQNLTVVQGVTEVIYT
jgi:hypothetical protein